MRFGGVAGFAFTRGKQASVRVVRDSFALRLILLRG